MSFKRMFLRNSIRDEIKERQRAWRRDKYDPALRQAREMISSKIKKRALTLYIIEEKRQVQACRKA